MSLWARKPYSAPGAMDHCRTRRKTARDRRRPKVRSKQSDDRTTTVWACGAQRTFRTVYRRDPVTKIVSVTKAEPVQSKIPCYQNDGSKSSRCSTRSWGHTHGHIQVIWVRRESQMAKAQSQKNGLPKLLCGIPSFKYTLFHSANARNSRKFIKR